MSSFLRAANHRPAFFNFDMRRLDNGFYQSKAWEKCRRAYIKSVGGLCEKCKSMGIYSAGVIVHHIEPLTEENYMDESISLNPDNLMLLCRSCHEQIHKSKVRYYFNSDGDIVEK